MDNPIKLGAENVPLLLDAAKHLLGSIRWRIESGTDQTRFRACPPAGTPLMFGTNSSEAIDIVLVNDAYASAEKDAGRVYVDLEGLATLRHTPGESRVFARFGRDLLFPDLAGACRAYAQAVLAEHMSIAEPGRSPPQPPPLRRIDASLHALEPTDWRDLAAASAAAPCRMLLACDPELDRTALFLNQVFLPHAERVAATESMAIPLFVPAAEMLAAGYQAAVHRACQAATGAALSGEFFDRLLALGYFHVYVPDADAFQIAGDLDPSTRHFGALLDSVADLGGFTLGCDREFAFHLSNMPGAHPASPIALKLAGTFFVSQSDAGFGLFDTGEHAARFAPLPLCQTLAGRIAELSEGRLSDAESKMLVQRLACADYRSQGQGITAARIEEELRRLLRGERLRPANIGFALSAVLNAGLLRMVTSDLFLFASTPLRLNQVTEAVFTAIESRFLYEEDLSLRAVLQFAGLSQHIFRSAVGAALARYGEPFAARLPLYIETLLRRVRADRDAAASEQGMRYQQASVFENILRLAIVAATTVSTSQVQVARNLKAAYGEDPVIEGLSLPQFSFIGLNLARWRFSDCMLRNALFLNCKLGSAQFQNSVVAGASFLNCRFDKSNRFESSDFSGVIIKSCAGIKESVLNASTNGGGLDGTIWTTASIETGSAEADVDAVFGAFEDLAQSVSIAAMQIATAQDTTSHTRSAAWPMLAQQSFFLAATGSRWVPVFRLDEPSHEIIPVNQTAAYWQKVFPDQRPHPPATRPLPDSWINLTNERRGAAAQSFVGLTVTGDLWVGLARGETLVWHHLASIAHAKDLAVRHQPPRGSGAPVDACNMRVAIATNDRSAVIRLYDVRGPNHVSEQSIATIESCPAVTAMRWIDPVHAGANSLELLVGTEAGLFSLVCAAGCWRLERLAQPSPTAPIEAIGFGEGQNLIVACVAGGLIVGYRHIAAGRVQEVFRYKSSFGQWLEAVPLNQYGQLLLVGKSGGSSPQVLWSLLQPSGRVVATVPLADVEFYRATGRTAQFRDPTRQEARSSVAANAIRAALRRLRPASSNLHLSPRSSRDIELILVAEADESGRSAQRLQLPERFENEIGTYFRTIAATIDDQTEHGTTPPPQLYLDAMIDAVDILEHQVRVRLRGNFREPVTTQAKLRLSIAYLPEDASARIDGQWDFQLVVNWEDNPFRHDGHPVSGDQYFGFAAQNEAVRKRVQSLPPEHQIVEASRRAGKTSFIRRVVLDLQNETGVNYAAAVVSGELIQSADLNLMQVLAAELRTIGRNRERPSYTELAAWIDSGKVSRAARGDVVDSLVELAKHAQHIGLSRPLILGIDEWGYLGKRRKDREEDEEEESDEDQNPGWKKLGQQLTARADILKAGGVCLILTSVPGDFHATFYGRNSGDWRYFSSVRESLGRLDDGSMQELIHQPLLKRGFSIGAEEEKVVKRLASRAPHDANIILHHAFNAALSDPSARSADGKWRIAMHHILPRQGQRSEMVEALVAKYDAMQNYLMGNKRLTPAQRQIFSEWAGIGGCPTLDNPEGGAKAKWDEADIPVPMLKNDDRDGCIIFGDAGFREPMERDRGSNADAVAAAHKLWIPWGLAESIRRYRTVLR